MFKHPQSGRAFFRVVLLTALVCVITYYYLFREPKAVREARKCFLHNGRKPNDNGTVTYFEDISTSPKIPAYDESIFFIETRCSESAIADLKPRYACSIETAARANPDRDIFMIFSSPVGLPRHPRNWPLTIKTLMEYPNIHFRNIQVQQLSLNTPLENWDWTKLFTSFAKYEHASDIIRYLLLYKYGGTYLDQDYMMVKSLDSIDRNWITFQNEKSLASALLDFRHNGIGHFVLDTALSEIVEQYRPDILAYNGPDLWARIMKKLCDVDDIAKAANRTCSGVRVHAANRFFPLWGPEARFFFDPNATKALFKNTTGMMGFHYWNSESKRRGIEMGNGAAYDVIAKQHCPLIYAEHEWF